MFSDEDSSVLVSTIHKVKGKEFDHVWLMHSGIFMRGSITSVVSS